MIFVDSNVLIDIVARGGPWFAWSSAALARATAQAPLVASRIVLAELAPSFTTLAVERGFVAALGISLHDLSDEAAFLAGKAHAAYRRAGGAREAILADFLIGGHAAALGARLLTRDRRRFAAYFPDLTLITPETDHG